MTSLGNKNACSLHDSILDHGFRVNTEYNKKGKGKNFSRIIMDFKVLLNQAINYRKIKGDILLMKRFYLFLIFNEMFMNIFYNT